MKKSKNLKCIAYDVAAGPIILMFVGVPLLVIGAIVGLTIFSFKIIKKERAKQKLKEQEERIKDKERDLRLLDDADKKDIK